MPKLEISTPTYERLLRRSASFDDTAEDVIRRLLDQAESAKAPGRQTDPESQDDGRGRRATAPAAPGSILPVGDYWLPILGILVEEGGSAAANDVIQALDGRMGKTLNDRDREVLRNGEVRWRNRARFARLRMKERGLLSDTSHRGVWEITDAGRKYLAERD